MFSLIMDTIDAGVPRQDEELQRERIEAPRGSSSRIERQFHEHIVGQDEGVKACARAVDRAKSTIRSSRDLGPIMVIAELGASGAGKTEMANVMGEVLSGDSRNRGTAIRIDCGTLGGEAGKARLIGAESGYKGYGDAPAITQQKIAENAITYTDRGGRTRTVTIILFDEVEKAAPEVRETLLGPFDKKNGILQLGNGEVSFRDTIVVLTSNLGNPAAIAERRRLEESPAELERAKSEFIASGELTISDDAITARTGAILKQNSGMDQSTAREQAFLELQNEATLHLAARREIMRAYSDAIAPEFRGRVDEAAVFDPIKQEQLGEILDMRVADVIETFAESGINLRLAITDRLRAWLIERGYDPETNARAMGGVVDQYIQTELELAHDGWLKEEPTGFHRKDVVMDLYDVDDPDDQGYNNPDYPYPIRFNIARGFQLEEQDASAVLPDPESGSGGSSAEVDPAARQAFADVAKSFREDISERGLTEPVLRLIDKLPAHVMANTETIPVILNPQAATWVTAPGSQGPLSPELFERRRARLVEQQGVTPEQVNGDPNVRKAIANLLQEAREESWEAYEELRNDFAETGLGTPHEIDLMFITMRGSSK